MSTHDLPVLIPVTLLLGALVSVLLGLWKRALSYPTALVTVGVSLLFSAFGLHHVMTVGTIRSHVGGWPPPIGIEYVMDPLSAFLSMVILSIAVLVFVHSRTLVEKETEGKSVVYYGVALLLLAGFCGIVLTGDLFNLYVFLEIAALSSYALIAVGEKHAPVAAFRYLLVGSVGASFYLLGVGFLYIMTGSLNMADVARILPGIVTEPPLIIGLVLMFVGMGIKMALFPLHGWQPDAYTYAPSASTALLAPIATKVGAYVLIRILLYVFEPNFTRSWLSDILLWLSLGGILYGSIMAMAQQELKRMLAYSSIAQIGYIGLGVGLATPAALTGAILHVLNHAFMKGGLFVVAGNLRLQIGHSTIAQFDESLRKAMPWTMAAFTVFALSMIGIPPLAGFFSKWYLVLGGIERQHWVSVAIILLSSLLNAVYFFRVLEKVYLRPLANTTTSTNLMAHREVKGAMLLPTLIMASAIVLLGVFNTLIVTKVIAPMIPPGL